MRLYSSVQLDRYFEHIGHKPRAGDVSLDCLTQLQMHHLARVPFESIALHYSKDRLLSLDPEDLFIKIVERSRGGYCMEVNTFFATVLRTLGFSLISAGARVKEEDEYHGWNHMVNIVSIGAKRYLVDVGYGSNVPPIPVALEDGGVEFEAVAPTLGRLEYKSIPQYTDPTQRVWVFSIQDQGQGGWKEQYCFVDQEFLPQDFEVMNFSTMASPTSFFVKTVVATRTILDDRGSRAVGVMILHKDYVKRRLGAVSEILENLETEEQRVAALEKYFRIILSSEEQGAIRGLGSELGQPPAGTSSSARE